MGIDFAGAAVGTAFGLLLAVAKNVVTTVAAFSPRLENIKSTLRKIEPFINDIDKCNTPPDYPYDVQIRDLLDEGKRLDKECSRISRHQLWKQYNFSNKLTKFNAALENGFQVYTMTLTGQIMLKLKGSIVTGEAQDQSGQAYGRNLQSIAGTAEGAAFSELSSLVTNGVQIPVFRPQLKKIKSTLTTMEPIIKQLDVYNKEMSRMEDLFVEGKRLIGKSLKIKPHNLIKRYVHSKKLINFNEEVEREFQIYIPLLNAINSGKILWELKDTMTEDLESGLGGNLGGL